ncbi:MAG: MAPEG family protein [Burkholderiales bacterium]|nr:MAPEG family protein [Burkholderiales bacterium]
MNTPSAFALAGLLGWTLLLLVLMEMLRVSWVMEMLRVSWVLRGGVAANEFRPDNANLSPFMQRLARAHANCIEGLPLFGGLLLLAIATQHTAVTDTLAPWMLAARVVQSSVHLASISVPAVNLRFAAFCVQLVIATRWTWGLLAS